MRRTTKQNTIADAIRECHTAPRFSVQHFTHIAVVPTYQWNGAEPDLPDWHTRFPMMLTSAYYTTVLERWTTLGRVRTLTFLGGEPTLWPELDTALFAAHARGIVTILETNALTAVARSTPKYIRINLRTYLEHTAQAASIQTTIAAYQARGVRMIGILPLREHDTPTHCAAAYTLCHEFQLPLLVFPAFGAIRRMREMPVTQRAAIVAEWHKLQSMTDTVSHAPKTPWWHSAETTCHTCPNARLTLQPDGTHLTLCPFWDMPTTWNSALQLTEIYQNTWQHPLATIKTCPAMPS